MTLFLAGLMGVLVVHLVHSFSTYRLATNKNIPGAWVSWIPFFNWIILCRIVGLPGWLMVILFVPIVGLLFMVYIGVRLCQTHNRPAWLGILLPAMGVLLPVLAFTDDEWMKRNGRMAFAGGVLAILGIPAAMFMMVIGTMKSSEGYQLGLRQAGVAPALIESLGEPIVPGWYVTGNAGTGNARLYIPVSGPRGKGTVYVSAVNSPAGWRIRKLEALIANTQQHLILLDKSDGH